MLANGCRAAECCSVRYKVVQIWPGLFVCKQVTVCPGHIWTTLYISCSSVPMTALLNFSYLSALQWLGCSVVVFACQVVLSVCFARNVVRLRDDRGPRAWSCRYIPLSSRSVRWSNGFSNVLSRQPCLTDWLTAVAVAIRRFMCHFERVWVFSNATVRAPKSSRCSLKFDVVDLHGKLLRCLLQSPICTRPSMDCFL